MEELSKCPEIAIRKMKIAIQPTCNSEDMLDALFDGSKMPGFKFQEVFDCKPKAEASKVAYAITKEKWNYISRTTRIGEKLIRSKLFPTIYTLGARNKRENDYEIS
jgi:hypothetical protein